MFFANEDHRNNYWLLMNRYKLKPGKDVQYEANIYIAAYPSIFAQINMDNIDIDAGPLYSLMLWDEQEQRHIFNAPGLTGSSISLVQVGLSLYNGYEIRLDDVFGYLASHEHFNVFVQACRIRASK